MIELYVIVATIVFLFLAIIWGKRGLMNVFIKTFFALLAGYGGYLIYVNHLLGG